MLILNSDAIDQTLTMSDAIEAMKEAFVAISSGSPQNPERIHMDFPDARGTTLVMPAYADSNSGPSFAVKIVSIFDDNPKIGLPRVIGAAMVLEPSTGKPIALLDGSCLTALRTAAATAAATDVLARRDSTRLGIIGTGVLARSHLRAICAVRQIDSILVASRSLESATRFAKEQTDVLRPGCSLECVSDVNRVVRESDIICTVTSSSEPVFDDLHVPPGCHINAIGSYQPSVAEIPEATVARSRLFVDQRSAALKEAGDILRPIGSGLIDDSHIQGEIGQVIRNQVAGRQSDKEVTLFKSVGNSIQDCICSQRIVAGAISRGIGQTVDF